MRHQTRLFIYTLVVLAVVCTGCDRPAQDEAMQAGKTMADFPEATADYFRDIDGGITLTPDEVKGRNTWLLWTGGNEAFWDWLANHSFGTFDLLKTLSSYPCSPEQEQYVRQSYASSSGEAQPYYRAYSRDTRFHYLGVMNEPGFRKPTKPDEFGLCLDERVAPAEPFDAKVYGRASGIVGLRLYPNPHFDAKAKAHWKADLFYNDPVYASDSQLVRPYRVGMSCAFCHISYHPLSPPTEPEKPEWRNFSATIGAQYFWFGRIFGPNLRPDNFVWHILDSARPGAVDTSFVPTDYINNPRAMNAVFNVATRLATAGRFHQETNAGGARDLPEVKTKGPTFGVPHILWDGADSVGIDAALTRVYINIGEYHQEWIRHVQPLVGLKPQSPIEVKVAQQNSVYWNVTQARAGNLATYLIRASGPMYLKDVEHGQGAPYLQGEREPQAYEEMLTRGKVVFAEQCARCHSSKIPSPAPGLDEGVACGGSNYLKCWERYWEWTQTTDFKQKMTEIVMDKNFLQDNYLSTDARIPVTLLETEICSSMASNAIAGRVWDNFSSATYKSLPAMSAMQLYDPMRNERFSWDPPGGGRGYQRVPSLIAIWATAPFLHNNEIGKFTNDPSVAGRLEAFNDAVHKLLWPERRANTVRRTDRVTALKIYTSALPRPLYELLEEHWFKGLLRTVGLGGFIGDATIEIGPIPKGTPINLLSNFNLDFKDPRVDVTQMAKLLVEIKQRLKEIHQRQLGEQQATEILKELVPQLIKRSACPDFVVDRGHYFGRDLPDADKEALIEFVKTF